MRLFRRIIQYFKSLFGVEEKRPHTQRRQEPAVGAWPKPHAKSSKKVEYISKQVNDLPEEDEVEFKTIYIVGEHGYQWLVAFRCPCGCKEIIKLNLLSEASPCWKVSYNHQGKVSLSPSIDRKVGCRSHFILKKGYIDWWSDVRKYWIN